MRVQATRPLNGAAVKAANDAFYANHPEMVSDGRRTPIDPCATSQARLREEWITAYAANRGKLEAARGSEQACAARELQEQAAQMTRSVVAQSKTNCPNQPTSQAKALPPPQSKPATETVKPCRLTSLALTCQHGRPAGPEGVLMVVPDSTASLGDSVNGSMGFEGGCGDHAAWSVAGILTKEGRGTAFDFKAQTVVPSITGFASLQNVSPQRYEVTGQSCSGGRTIQVHAYPPGKTSYKVDLATWREKFRDALHGLPLSDEDKKGWETKWLRGGIEYSGQWQEMKATGKLIMKNLWPGNSILSSGGQSRVNFTRPASIRQILPNI